VRAGMGGSAPAQLLRYIRWAPRRDPL
jgi:hypothetical protein